MRFSYRRRWCQRRRRQCLKSPDLLFGASQSLTPLSRHWFEGIIETHRKERKNERTVVKNHCAIVAT